MSRGDRKGVIRLLYPQHLDGIWTGPTQSRLTYNTLGEYTRVVARLKYLQNSGAFRKLFLGVLNNNVKILCYLRKIRELFGSFFG